jgi:shikimate kinase
MAAIYLIGFMGSGKSTVGRALAAELQVPFRDLDQIIEAAQGRTIASIFDTEGEAAFRLIETAALAREIERAQLGERFVLALGGGAFAQAANRAALRQEATIWLDCPLERARARVAQDPQRPNARDPERFARLFAERQSAYAQARHRVPIDSDDPAPAVAAILAQFLPGE